MTPPLHIIFDCDGVLVDSELIANAVLAELITALGHPTTVEDSIRTYTGRSLKDVLATAEKLLGRAIPQDTGDDYGRRLFDRFRRELTAVEGVQAAIAALPYRRCVASSSAPERLTLALEVTGLAPLFGRQSTARSMCREANRRRTCSCSQPARWANRRLTAS